MRGPAAHRRAVAFGTLFLVTAAALAWSLSGHGRTAPAASGATGGQHSKSLELAKLVDLFPKAAGPDGSLPTLPYPKKGEGAVAVLGSGVISESAHEKPVPIASLTKMMTAYLVLRAHPLAGRQHGPTLTLTGYDHALWAKDSASDLSNVEVKKGERLTERQLLDALLIPSADNVANILAHWVAGSQRSFVRMMNEAAAKLGMEKTRYADASGVDPRSVSTAADQALLATVIMRNPVVRRIVETAGMPFPVEGHIWNYNPVLGSDGIVGVKSGFTGQALGCLVTAAYARVGSRRVLLIASVTGQKFGLYQAGQEDVSLTRAAFPHLRVLLPFGPRQRVATVEAPWSRSKLGAFMARPVSIVGWGGLRLTSRLRAEAVPPGGLRRGWPKRTEVASLALRSRFGPVGAFPVLLSGRLPGPPGNPRQPRRPLLFAVSGR